MSEAELREKIHSALFVDDFPILNDIEKDAVDRVVAIIQAQKADRKRVALEARIDELTLLADFQMGDITIMGRNERSWRDRISELEQNVTSLTTQTEM